MTVRGVIDRAVVSTVRTPAEAIRVVIYNKCARGFWRVDNSSNAPIVMPGRSSDDGSGSVLAFLRMIFPFRATATADTRVWRQADY